MTSIPRPVFALGGLLVLASACATTTDASKAVTERAAFDLGCPADQLEVVPLPGGSLGVRGCGVRATYVFAEPECRSARMMTRGDFSASCTPILDFKGHDKPCSCEGMDHGKAHHELENAHDKAHQEAVKEHAELEKAHETADHEGAKEDDDNAGDDKAGVKAGD